MSNASMIENRRNFARTLSVCTWALTACTALRAEVVDIRWSSDGRFERRIEVAAGKVAEVCGSLPSGSKIGWQFDASAPLEFNIHYHVEKDGTYPVKPATMTRADDVLAVVVAQDYCWMWRNRSATTVTLNLSLRRPCEGTC